MNTSMKIVLLFLSIIMALSMKNAAAQNNTAKNIIVLVSGDTLTSVQIVKNKAFTNEDKIEYIDSHNHKQKLEASQITAYYYEKGIFYSEKIKNEGFNKLISYSVVGYIGLGFSYTSDGGMNFYTTKNEEVTALEKYKYDLEPFFRNYLDDFDNFYSKYKVKVSYDFKTLAEMVSAYNAYKYPEKYTNEKYSIKDAVNFSVFASGGFVNSAVSGYFKDNLTGSSYSFGFDLEAKNSRVMSIHIPVSYNKVSAKGSDVSIHFTTINLEPYMAFRGIPNNKVSFEFGVGLGLMYSLKSYIDCSSIAGSDQGNVDFKNLSVGPNISLITNINKKLKVQLMFVSYQTKSGNTSLLSPEDTSVKARINNLRAMISYRF